MSRPLPIIAGRMTSTPLVSIVIPVFNGSSYLRDAIDSALAQTYRNVEAVVVNDGSDDAGRSERIARSYGEHIIYLAKPNGGVASALNLALGRISGDYWSWLSHDDWYSHDKIEIQMRHLVALNDPRTAVYSDYSIVFEGSNATRTVRLKEVPPERFRYFITLESSLHGCTLLLPRSAWLECGPFDEKLLTTQDYELWFRMAEHYRFIHVPEILVHSRFHAGQGSMKLREVALREGNSLRRHFVDSITGSELTMATGQSLLRSYADLAARLAVRGFSGAAWCAARRAIREFGHGTRRDDVIAWTTLVGTLLLGLPLGLARSVASARLRGIIIAATGGQ